MNKIQEILSLALTSPVIVVGGSAEILKSAKEFSGAEIIKSNLKSADLGITSTAKGLKAPKWFARVIKDEKELLFIEDIDKIDTYEQGKFTELLKYQTLSGVEFPSHMKIILTASNLKNINENILRLCQVYDMR